MRRIVSIVLLILTFLLTSCGNQSSKQTKENEISITGIGVEDGADDYDDLYESDAENTQKSYGNFGFGVNTDVVKVDDNGMITFTCQDVVKVPYHVENIDEKEKARFGLIAFTDGVVQPFWLEDLEGNKIEDEKYMHNFDLELGESQQFNLVFHPVKGKKGKKVGFISATILNPDFVPENENSNFGVYYALSATVPQQIEINEEIASNDSVDKSYTNKDIPKDLLGKIESSLAGETLEEHLESTYDCKIESIDDSKAIDVTDGKANFRFSCYGGPEVLRRLTIFVNQEPIKVNDADYIEFKTEMGKMTTIDLSIDVSQYNLKEFSTIYGVVMTAGTDYTVADIAATKPLVLMNQK